MKNHAKDTAFEDASDAQLRKLIRKGHEAQEFIDDHMAKNRRAMEEHRERVAKAHAAREATPEHQRRRDAVEKVAADIARRSGKSFSEVRSMIASQCERMDRVRGR